MALSDPPTAGECECVQRLAFEVLGAVSAASAAASANLDDAAVLARLRVVGRDLATLAPVLVHLVSLAGQHLPALVVAMRRDVRARHLLGETSTNSPSEGTPSRKN